MHQAKEVKTSNVCMEYLAIVGRPAGGARVPLAGDATNAPSCAEPRAAHLGGGGSGVMTAAGVCIGGRIATSACILDLDLLTQCSGNRSPAAADLQATGTG